MAALASLVGAAGGPLSLASAGLGLVNSIPSFIAAAKQKRAYKNVKLQDTTPAAFREALALSKQGATAQLPGLGAAQNRLAQTQASGAATLLRGSGSSAAILGGLTAGNAQRLAGEQQLGVQSEQYRQGAQRTLARDLQTQADYQTNDLNNYNKERAAYLQSSNENLSRALGSITGGVASGINLAQPRTNPAATSDAPTEPLTPYNTALRVPGRSTTPPAILPRYTPRQPAAYNALSSLTRRGIPRVN